MSICGALVSSEWFRLAIFKEVTTTVWRLMAHVIFFWQKQNQIYQNTLKKSQNKWKKNLKQECQFCVFQTHTCAFCVCLCLCVLEMRHRVGRSYNMDQDPYSQKHFIGGSTDQRSLIRPLWSIKFQSLLKGKTYRGSAPILCCCSSSTIHIQINEISQSRQWDCSLKVWNCRLGTSRWGGAERNAALYRFVYLHITSGWGGTHTISQSCVCMCMCVHMCVCGG